ncbi:hypothetical protein FB00_00185 [Cellulosimicrobium funkei]|uniref:Uncharacterized protein n=2 Tax=Cellulosimicrobium funkei TaxID=264251 RepID=A0A0H2KRY5_9MICO|nr:hypothetical protein FB00_00185 [Cellulosimicrobium funkei]
MDGMTEDVWDDGSDDRARGDRSGGGRGPDGRDEAFRPVRGWGVLWRSAFVLWHGGHEYVVDVDFLDWDERIRLYRDRRLVDEQRSRARFDLPGVRIEARMSLYGMRYVRVVDAVGDVRDVPPMPGTAEAWRDRMDRERPTASRAVGIAAWVVLVVALVTQVPQLLDLVSGVTGWTPPFVPDLPAPVNTVLSVAGVVAAVDRGLRRRYHPLLDG